MDHGWCNGMEKRRQVQQMKRAESRGNMKAETLPDIRPGTSSPTSQSSPASPAQLGNSASEPRLPSSPQSMRATHDGAFGNGPRATTASSTMRLGAKAQKFIERQFKHSSIEARRSMSLLHRQIVKDSSEADEAKFQGSKGIPGFREFLRKQYGSIIAGWRVLDSDKSGRLSFYEFCNACRKMGFSGNLRKLWEELDVNQDGSVSLMEIDPEVGRYIGFFKLALMKKYGSVLKGWQQCIDTNKSGRIEEKEIVAAVKTLELDLEPKKLFKMLVSGPKGLGLTLAEFDPEAYHRFFTGDTEGLMSKGDKEFLEDLPGITEQLMPDDAQHAEGGGAKKYRAKLVKSDRDAVKEAREAVTKFALGLHTVDGFKAALINRCGSLLSAWRVALDLDGNGRLTFGEFTQALSRLAFHGNVQGLWKEFEKEGLTGVVPGERGSGYLLFKDLDPATAADLIDLRAGCEKVHGNMLLAWLQAFDTKGTGLCNEALFINACGKVGLEAKDGNDPAARAKHLFKVMQPDASRTSMTLQDFDTKAFLALSRGDFRMISEKDPKAGKKPLEMSFDERQQEGFYFKIRRAWEAARQEEFAKATKQAAPPEHALKKEEFEALCIRKYGTIIAAFRNCLDADGNGRLTFNEMCQSARKLGYAGNLQELWSQYDVKKKGWVALKDLDPEADMLVGDFLLLLATRYGTLDNAWKVGFNKDPHGCIDEKELTEACQQLGYEHDAKTLFQCLSPVPGRQLITIWDLDPLCTRNRQRGDAANLNDPKDRSKAKADRVDNLEGGNSLMAGNSMMTAETHNTSQTSFRTTTPGLAGSVQSSLCLQGVSQNEQMRYAMKQKYGSTLAAWRSALDPHMKGYVGFGKFCLALENMSYHGNIKAMWQDLCGLETDKSMCSYKDIDDEGQHIVDSVRQQLVEKYECLHSSWIKGLDPEGQGCLDEVEFKAAWEQTGFNAKNAKKVFKMLLPHPGSRSVKLQDLEALLVGVDPEERAKTWAGTPENELSNSSNLGQSHREWGKAAREADGAKNFMISNIDDFKKMLVTKYGSLFAAWRHGLDVDQNGVVTQRDFSMACNFLGVKHALSLWKTIDSNQNGQMSLRELDLDTGKAFETFEKLLIEGYGNCKEGWRKCFDPKKKLMCDKESFIKGCSVLGYPGGADVPEPEKFFKLLKPEAGLKHLTYEDIWLNMNPNDNKHVDEFDIHRSPLGSPKSNAHLRPMSPMQTEPTNGLDEDVGNEQS